MLLTASIILFFIVIGFIVYANWPRMGVSQGSCGGGCGGGCPKCPCNRCGMPKPQCGCQKGGCSFC
jgi:hypothetical protein